VTKVEDQGKEIQKSNGETAFGHCRSKILRAGTARRSTGGRGRTMGKKRENGGNEMGVISHKGEKLIESGLNVQENEYAGRVHLG